MMNHTKHPLAAAKSHRRGELDPATQRLVKEIVQTKLGRVPTVFELDYLDEVFADPESFTGDIFVHDGDLRIDGDFDAEDVMLLLVRGDLIVTGCYRDSDDPQNWVVVNGAMRARDVVTAGVLYVEKTLDVEGTIFGDYNDGGAQIVGDVTCKLFFAGDHSFVIDGTLQAKHYLAGDVEDRVQSENKPIGGEIDYSQLVRLFGRDLFDEKILEGDGRVEDEARSRKLVTNKNWPMFAIDWDKVAKRVQAGTLTLPE
jgi:cytoskeletal protein CcmA (bactofilin family)